MPNSAKVEEMFDTLGLFCRISSLLDGSFAKETYDLKEPTNRSRQRLKRCLRRCIVCSKLYCVATIVCSELYCVATIETIVSILVNCVMGWLRIVGSLKL